MKELVFNKPNKVIYTNYKLETAERNIVPFKLWYGHTQYHLEDCWLVNAYDLEKMAIRDFKLNDMYVLMD